MGAAPGPGDHGTRALARLQPSDAESELAQDLVEETDELAEQARERATIQEAGDRAEQVAEQLTRTGSGDDVEHDLLEVYLETQDVEVEGAQHQVQDVAGTCSLGTDREAGELLAVDLGTSRVRIAVNLDLAPRSW